jgi:hypothetical protein
MRGGAAQQIGDLSQAILVKVFLMLGVFAQLSLRLQQRQTVAQPCGQTEQMKQRPLEVDMQATNLTEDSSELI